MALLLRNVELHDVDSYVAMRCDPVMMAELGGPLLREGIEAKVARDVEAASTDASWILMIVPDDRLPETVAGSVVLWPHKENGTTISEVGWMVLPQFQRQGLGKASVRELLERARDDGRWGTVHAFPGVTNTASNGICRSLGFTLLGEEDIDFGDRKLRANHWATDLANS